MMLLKEMMQLSRSDVKTPQCQLLEHRKVGGLFLDVFVCLGIIGQNKLCRTHYLSKLKVKCRVRDADCE